MHSVLCLFLCGSFNSQIEAKSGHNIAALDRLSTCSTHVLHYNDGHFVAENKCSEEHCLIGRATIVICRVHFALQKKDKKIMVAPGQSLRLRDFNQKNR